MRKMLMLAAMAAMTAGCESGRAPANESDNAAIDNAMAGNAADATNYQAEVIGLPLSAREGVFLRAVRDAGFNCQNVTESERMDDREGNPAWRATCDGRTPHIISITRDGTAKIVSRTDAR